MKTVSASSSHSHGPSISTSRGGNGSGSQGPSSSPVGSSRTETSRVRVEAIRPVGAGSPSWARSSSGSPDSSEDDQPEVSSKTSSEVSRR